MEIFHILATKIKEQFLLLKSQHKQSDKKYFIFLFFLSVILYSSVVFKVKTIVWGDSLYYYAYTKSIIIDHDIDFRNEAYRDSGGFPNKPEISEITGKIINKFSPGTSILWMPGFLLGHSVSSFLGFIGIFGEVDGYNFITQYFVAVSTILFSTLGLFFIYKTISLFFERKIAFLTILFFYLTTQMFYYTSIDPLNSHSASFMLSSLFLYLLAVFSKNNEGKFGGEVFSWQKMIMLGVLGGAITLVRNQDLVVLLPVSIYFLARKNAGLMEIFNRMILFWGSVFLLVSIQFFMTLTLYGQLGSPYIIGGEKLSWLNPDFFRVLFSFGNGLFTFAPILIVSVVGLVIAQTRIAKSQYKVVLFKRLSLISIIVFFLQLYVVASWGKEIIGGPYGSRMFISVLPYLSLGLATIFKRYKNYAKFNLISHTGLVLLFVNNLIQTAVMLIRF
ncbi:hypothetical protein KKD03_03635 [Patescibacteria group bacterium]|nr:hypothetical protein [Patescibacteria group bacterium]